VPGESRENAARDDVVLAERRGVGVRAGERAGCGTTGERADSVAERRLVQPGQLLAWDPSQAHGGSAVADRQWSSRLIVVEVADLVDLAGDDETDLLADIAFPDPVIADPELAAAFLRLHTALEEPALRLERDELLFAWLSTLIERFSTARPPRPPLSPREDRAFRVACDYLADQPERNIGLDELAAAAGIG